MWVVWEERNRRMFEGVENDFVQLKKSFISSFFLVQAIRSYLYKRLSVLFEKHMFV